MTPFDPDALVAMLQAFYQPPSGTLLVRARGERPDYFVGGTIFGSKSDKLRLPDGREFDCIVAAGGPVSGRRWQCALITPGDPGDADPFPLEPGPLEPMDEEAIIVPGGDPTFEGLLADGLRGLNGADAVLALGADAVIAFDGAARLDGDYRDKVEPARDAHEAIRRALEGDNPSDVYAAAQGHGGEIESGREDYVEPPQPDIYEPDPGPVPRDDDRDPPGRE